MTARSTPQGLAPLLELLEVEHPRVVTVASLSEYARHAGVDWPTHVIAQRLRGRGWLLPLQTRGVWEFAPAARAGVFGSDDPLIELRAVLARDPRAPYAAAAESAAYLLGFASRRPEPECVGAPPEARPPKSLRVFRIVRWRPAIAPVLRDGLPVWAPATLLAFMVARPGSYRDWSNVGEWLAQAAAAVEPDALAQELEAHSAGSWRRAAYLLTKGGAPESAAALMRTAPSGSGPYYLGNRVAPGRYDREFDVIDSTGMEVRQVTSGFAAVQDGDPE